MIIIISLNSFFQIFKMKLCPWVIWQTTQGKFLLSLNPVIQPTKITWGNYFLEHFLEAEIQEKIDEVKKKENTAMLIHSNLLGPKFKRQIFQKKLETGQPQDSSLAKSQRVEKRLLRVKRLLKALRASGKGTAKRWPIRASRGNRMRSPLWRTLSKEEDSGGRPKELEQLHMVHRPGKWVENSFHTEPSFIKEQNKAAVLLPWDNTWWAGLLPPLLQKPYLRLKKNQKI